MSDGNNMREFPIERIRLKKKTSANQRNLFSYFLENRKALVSLSLISVFVVISILNREITSQNNPTNLGSRAIASFGEPVKIIRNTAWEYSIARKLSKVDPTKRTIARGKKPSNLDQLTYGQLEGKYSVHLADGKLTEIKFTSNSGDPLAVTQIPSRISNRKEFLYSTRGLLPYEFAEVKKLENRSSAEFNSEVYALVDKLGAKVAEIVFQLDASGRFLSMKVFADQNVAALEAGR